MPTVAEVLKQSGLSQELIDAIDAKALSALNGYVSNVEQTAAQKEQAAREAAAKAESDRKAAEASAQAAKEAQDAAELNKRSVDEFWKNTYTPGLSAWEAERAKLAKEASDRAAEAAYYKTQRESYLKNLGIDPASAPEFKPAADPNAPNNNNGNGAGGTRDAQGRFVPNVNPGFDPNVVISRVGDGMNMIQNIMWKYQTLHNGQPLPIAPTELIQQADSLKLSPMEYAARTFKFAEKEQAAREAAAKAHDDAIRAERDAAKDAEWKAKLDDREKEFAAKERLHAERAGNNPDQRVVVSSKIPDLQRQVESKNMTDPLLMNENQRRAQTSKMIRDQIEQSKAAA